MIEYEEDFSTCVLGEGFVDDIGIELLVVLA